MVASLLKRVFGVAAVWLLRRYTEVSLDVLKIRAAIYYVRGVQSARSATIGVLLALGLIAVMGAGLMILPIGLTLLVYGLSHSWGAACIVLLGMGGLYVIVPLYILRRCMSERAWMNFFKVGDLVARVTREPKGE